MTLEASGAPGQRAVLLAAALVTPRAGQVAPLDDGSPACGDAAELLQAWPHVRNRQKRRPAGQISCLVWGVRAVWHLQLAAPIQSHALAHVLGGGLGTLLVAELGPWGPLLHGAS